MKKGIIIILSCIVIASTTFAQPPQAFKYQAVVRDATGGIISNEPVDIRIGIRDGWGAGTIIYRETHSVTSNQFGLINLSIGWGIPGTGYNFLNIDWSLNEKFIEVELWDDELSTYISMGTSMLYSVPYSLYSGDDGDWIKDGDDIYTANSGNVGIGTNDPLRPLSVIGSGSFSNSSDWGLFITPGSGQSGSIGTRTPNGSYSNISLSWGETFLLGNVAVTGSLSKGSGSFVIDHPLDPENKLLRHNFVESPENLLIYRGKAELNSKGEAIVKMPDYFQALTKEDEASIHLTCVGRPFLTGADWNHDFSAIIIYGDPNKEVFWEVLADRDDPVIHELGRPVEEEKGSENTLCEKGKLLYPEAYGYPESMGRDYDMKQLNKK